jgi:hypothetical protein
MESKQEAISRLERKYSLYLKFEKEGGRYLKAAREWIQTNLPNGDTVKWGSEEMCHITERKLEEFALDIAVEVLSYIPASIIQEKY